ncbi:MAG: RNA polymerase sigma factor [Bryobacteraceae bacterium]
MLLMSHMDSLELALYFADAFASPAARSLEDADLVRAVLGRDRKATAEFVQLFSGRVYGYVRSRLAPRTEQVDDLVHETFIAAWQRLVTFRGDSPLETWIIGIARHKIQDHYRDRLSQMEVWEDDLEDEGVNPAGPALDVEIDRQLLADRALAVLSHLPEHYATILLWRYWEHRSTREIGEAIGKTEKAVERLLARGREHFKQGWIDDRR